ncbi:hypothetical protein FY557_17365 [Chryseobacterium sp. SN22]|uniref:hypothetical protein n=1 Tax=Chryseobacterium sp. SN22 TaxID=2606431 RepID=UPI0011EEA285|nr:hypothetical protein [Chryseobacterium sp. SN22]KAA0126420.1 hypothetical protein FY557_17365 [Chryseobacterium sp. SN22]
MENTETNSIEIIINNPANTLSQSSIDLLRTIAKQSALNKIKADKWDKLDEKIGEFYFDDAEGDLVDIGEIAATELGYI